MPVDFLSDEQAAAFGRFTGSPSRLELKQSGWLDDADRALIARHRGESSRLGFGVQLATVRILGSFLSDPLDVPWALVTFIAGQLGVSEPSTMNSYADRSKRGQLTIRNIQHDWERLPIVSRVFPGCVVV